MGRKRKQRRQPHGSAWHWKQTDCWYYTHAGHEEAGAPSMRTGRGSGAARTGKPAESGAGEGKAFLGGRRPPGSPSANGPWLVARVCSEYLQYCERGLASGSITKSHRDNAASLAERPVAAYCGALPVTQLKKAHFQTWMEEPCDLAEPGDATGA